MLRSPHDGQKDPYRVLGVGKDVSDGEIKHFVKKFAVSPDRNPDDANAEAKFEVQSAYEKSNR